ncbi:GNAT family N-acetyltransferase [Massilia yuzhufengensis]|uniref:[SSU ribosomal protein S5P]-alanine acetyltransferase n=1 Tax=Massilia yuzhufengensis TaxID=1164594 RepID=A0A1I1NCT4_9BURK|nr:GNAT family protein [Massilia yuzhufengensis]SFC95166.1 [SSU ribosomal protein S5P]-alanine acetyltransferase [Massilia yuzhufengensis]
MITLVPPSHGHIAALLGFELANRAFFEATINARPASYYSLEGVGLAVGQAMADVFAGTGFQYVVLDGAGEIAGRVNLSVVKRAHYHSAVLGYRIGQAACGKGYASEAVRQMLEIAFGKLGLVRIEADCRVDNVASARVLLRNGFVQFGHSRRSFELGGVWYDRLHFEAHKPVA